MTTHQFLLRFIRGTFIILWNIFSPKIVSAWIQWTVFAKSSILDVWQGSKYVSDYLGAFCIIINWGYQLESFKNLSNLISILFKYIEHKLSFTCNKVIFKTCQNFTIYIYIYIYIYNIFNIYNIYNIYIIYL